jgi:hypothetical protein
MEFEWRCFALDRDPQEITQTGLRRSRKYESGAASGLCPSFACIAQSSSRAWLKEVWVTLFALEWVTREISA